MVSLNETNALRTAMSGTQICSVYIIKNEVLSNDDEFHLRCLSSQFSRTNKTKNLLTHWLAQFAKLTIRKLTANIHPKSSRFPETSSYEKTTENIWMVIVIVIGIIDLRNSLLSVRIVEEHRSCHFREALSFLLSCRIHRRDISSNAVPSIFRR